MRHQRSLAMGLLLPVLAGCAGAPDEKGPADTVVALRVAIAPDPKNGASDAAWTKARALPLEFTGGANFGARPGETGGTRGSIRAVYTADMLYLLLDYADATLSLRRSPYRKQADGSWKKLVDPRDAGGDDNLYAEDQWAILWPIGRSIPRFDEEGCAALCHLGEGKPYGNMYTAREGDRADLWHMKSLRTAPYGHVDDQYLDHTRHDPQASPDAGRKADPGAPRGDATPVPLVDGKPQVMVHVDRRPNTGVNNVIRRGDEVPFDDRRFQPGDEVASLIIERLEGDRADLRVVLIWSEGRYTSVVSRKLVTGSPYDVQFDDLGARYAFGVAVFDNAQVRHATTARALGLVFAP